MQELNYSITIRADKTRVWEIMLGAETYPQ